MLKMSVIVTIFDGIKVRSSGTVINLVELGNELPPGILQWSTWIDQ